MTAPSYLHGRAEWKGLKTIGAAVPVYEEHGVEKRDIRLTLSLIKQHPGKQSNIVKRRMARWSVDFLMQVLTGKGT